jgi:hypothetical protein
MRLDTFSTAAFTDQITIQPNAGMPNGAAGVMVVPFLIHGQLDASEVNTTQNGFAQSVAAADWRVRIQIGNSFFGSTGSFASGFFGSEVVDVSGAVSSSGIGPNALITVSAPIVIGTPFHHRRRIPDKRLCRS